MAEQTQLQNNSISHFNKGLHTDSSHINTPEGTYRFALNSVNETELGDFGFIGNEESNIDITALPSGYIPIEKCYIGDNETAIFSVSSDNTISEIGILDANANYTTVVNDALSIQKHKLNFKAEHQIQSVYRLRKGCEKTVYFTDGFNKPRYFNFSRLDAFKNSDDTWNAFKFNLQRTYESVPIFERIEVVDSGGNLESGSYNIAIQYIDESLNPTEFITVSNLVKIYNDLSNKSFREINGSINSSVDYLNFPKTSKAIKVSFEANSLDKNFLYYRLAIIESTNGSGLVNKVTYTENIPITKNFFIYTGSNGVTTGTEEEVLQFTNLIEKAGSIEQVENRLILANTTGNQTNFCRLQKYASKIKADCITKTVMLNEMKDVSNPKSPLQNLESLGYMPGEIYSFGIVYVFEDNTLSPVAHIPGKSNALGDKDTFTTGDNVFPMSTKNRSANTLYTQSQTCTSEDFWGLDSEGHSLTNSPVRHHRFPLRNDIEKPLIVDGLNSSRPQELYQLKLTIKGNLKTPYPCPENDPDCTHSVLPSFDVRVSYKIGSQSNFFIQSINPATYSNGENTSYDVEIIQNSIFHNLPNITDIVIEETDLFGTYKPQYSQWDKYFTAQPEYSTEVVSSSSTVQGRAFTTEILGIKFSNIEVPSLEDTGGKKVIGYFIVRNERTEFDKTILDTGVLVPSVKNEKYISHGLLQPDTDKISKRVFGVIHPEHKFLDKEYVTYDRILHQGNFKSIDKKYGKVNYDDVYDGSSFNKDRQKEGNDDGQPSDGSPTSKGYDGWSFNLITRDSILTYEDKKEFEIASDEIQDRFYLDALGNKSINDNANDVYNIACDNKIGMISLAQDLTLSDPKSLPYVSFYKENLDPYSNFRILPYYKENVNPKYFKDGEASEISIFNGDTYVSSMRYVNTVYWDNRIAKRAGKSNLLKKWVGAFLIVLGAVLAAIPGVGIIAIGAGIALIGAGTLFVSSGIKVDNFNKAYNEEYDKGLRQTSLDKWVDTFYNYTSKVGDYFPNPWTEQVKWASQHAKDGPSDDTIQWIGDCLTDLWFESSINTNLRHHFVDDSAPTYLDSPGRIEDGNNDPIALWEFFGIHYANSNWQRYPKSSLERHITRKLLAFDQTRDDNKYYIGAALGEYYKVNEDYLRLNKQKIFYHLPLEYDCCSDCKELFPHRVHYSEQSFQEELTDNYRTFLPNNYRDIEGETGEITNVFRLYNNLYIHTREALWLLPKNYQERVTDQIISFVGTGSYFEIPPQKIVEDDTGNSAGCQHKRGVIKTPAGIFFPSENQRKIYLYDGKQLKPISSTGLNSWFRNNMPLVVDQEYLKRKKELYPGRDNPSSLFGSGYISTYDSKKERFIITKKDLKLKETAYEEDSLVCFKGNTAVKFSNFEDIISSQASLGWNYLGLEDCKLKFFKDVIKTRKEKRYVVVNSFKDVDYLVFRYHFTAENGRDLDTRTELISPITRGPIGYGRNVNYDGQYLKWGGDQQGHGVECILIDLKKIKEDHPNTENVIFKCGAWWFGERADGNMRMDAEGYKGGIMEHTGYTQGDPTAFNFINTGGVLQGTYSFQTINIQVPPTSTAGTQDENFEPYNNIGLFTYNIKKGELSWEGTSGGEIPGESVVTEIEVNVDYIERDYKFIEGNSFAFKDFVEEDNSWTMSYSLKGECWVSWHSYLPNFYINIPDKFFSWKHGSNKIWEHNQLGSYQTFYGDLKPHIIEYTSASNALATKTWNHIMLQTEAKSYNKNLREYVDEKNITFNKAVLYNTRQCSGLMDLVVKDLDLNNQDYLLNQVINTNSNRSIIDRRERNWFINDFRDIRVDYTKPIWNSNPSSLQSEYYIDKILNTSTMDINKDWTQLENFRDKYLVVRLIFDKFANTKLITNFSIGNEQQSFF